MYILFVLLDQRLVPEVYVIRFYWIRDWCLKYILFVFIGSETGALSIFYSSLLDQRLVP